nr:S41 family peptidase [Streptomyces sp. SCL15-6]
MQPAQAAPAEASGAETYSTSGLRRGGRGGSRPPSGSAASARTHRAVLEPAARPRHPLRRHQAGVCADQQPHLLGTRFGGTKPVYVLTSSHTFSAAEELAYDLQQLGRAVVVGERTRGGAHPREGWTVHPHLDASIPIGRAVNPASGTNWEGTGVQPDVSCAPGDALDRAHTLARARLGG